jgi:STE24 endopeptidase
VDVRHDAGAHGGATLAKAAGGIALAGVWLAAAWLLLRTETPDGLVLPPLDPQAFFPAEHLERADRFRGVTRMLWAASVLVQLGVLALVVWRARPLADRLRPRVGGRVRTGVALALVALGATWLAGLPLGVFRHWWGRRYGLSEQGYAAWLLDRGISLALTALLLTIAVAGAVWLAGRLGSRWWIAAAPALVVLGVGYTVVQPVVIQPLFNRFEPLADTELAQGVERLGDEIGVRVERVEVADASRRTTTANAYVAGLGPTRRVVFYDTALDGRFTDEELLSLAAHELAHVERSHLWKGLAWFALLAVPGLALVAWGTERRGGLRGPALVPLGLLLALAFTLVTQPVANAVSRSYEAEADWIALEATDDPRSAIGLTVRFSLTGLGDPDPPGWSRVLLGTHPTALDRIAMAEAYGRGER